MVEPPNVAVPAFQNLSFDVSCGVRSIEQHDTRHSRRKLEALPVHRVDEAIEARFAKHRTSFDGANFLMRLRMDMRTQRILVSFAVVLEVERIFYDQFREVLEIQNLAWSAGVGKLHDLCHDFWSRSGAFRRRRTLVSFRPSLCTCHMQHHWSCLPWNRGPSCFSSPWS